MSLFRGEVRAQGPILHLTSQLNLKFTLTFYFLIDINIDFALTYDPTSLKHPVYHRVKIL